MGLYILLNVKRYNLEITLASVGNTTMVHHAVVDTRTTTRDKHLKSVERAYFVRWGRRYLRIYNLRRCTVSVSDGYMITVATRTRLALGMVQNAGRRWLKHGNIVGR